jgi:hypothetical protein
MVYDEYFPIGSAPTGDCQMHGAAAGLAVLGDSDTSDAGVGTSGVSAAGVMPASYGGSLAPAPAPGSHLQKVVGADGRAVWVVKH